MRAIAQTYLASRQAQQLAAAKEVLGQVAAVLHRGGDYRTAASLSEVLRVAHGEPPVLDEPVPGLLAAIHLARREHRDPQVMLPGERVRITFTDGAPSITGVWCFEDPSDVYPAGRTYVQRDDTGGEFDFNGGGWLQMRPVWFNLDQRDRVETVRRAVTVLASAWADPNMIDQVDDIEDTLTHEYVDYEQGVDPSHSQTEQQRHCECGELAVLRVTAWSAAPAREVIGEWARTEWSKPEEYGSQTVCSDTCAEGWVTKFRERSFDLLGEDTTRALQWNLEDWSYTPRWDDLPGVLALSRDSASMATELLMDATKAWFDGDFVQAGEHLTAARTAVATTLVRLAELEPSAGLLPSSGGTHPRAIAYEQWLQMAAPLVAKVLDDPHRYEIHDGGGLVYDRLTNQYYNGRTGRYAAVNVGRVSAREEK